ncbi:hypothetical protein [uncultured Aquitalea sp.]|uniref:hypothetical protein n=1 Tax=uncultured Aquitalea sp. TaxID=540272 RepID=UPI0025F9BFEE|nr:hypothetical protein [uncultured Aquitalea sp.]
MSDLGIVQNDQGDLLDVLETKGAELTRLLAQIEGLGGDKACAAEAAKRLAECLFWADRATQVFDGSI